jgi:F0F1-type ATP synthase delta subunit
LPTEIVTLDNLYTLLLNTLKSSFNSSNFIIDIYYDPKILGGIIFEHENFFLDLSIKSSLKKLVKIY